MKNISQSRLFKNECFVDGAWASAASGKTFDVFNPATEERIATVPDFDKQDTRQAVDAAVRAFPEWAGKTATERQKILERWYELIVENVDELAAILTLEQGKPHKEAKGEILNGAGFIKWYAEEGRRIYGDIAPSNQDDQRIVVLKQPVGVSAMITPWNFPSSMITRKVSAALAAGCPAIIKPAELTPLSALALGVLAAEAGLPNGVLNIVTGDAATVGDVLTSHPEIQKFSFTGSTAVGKKLMAQCATTVKKVSFELGGNAPFIVFKDADLDKAIDGVVTSKFRNAGQTCICANRIFVHEDIYETFLERFTKKTADLKLGQGQEDAVDIGPMISQDAVKKTKEILDDALEKGAVLQHGGNLRGDLGPQFLEPAVITNVDSSMRCFNEEIFGPVAAVYPFSSTQEVVKLANDTEYGLAAYIYTQDLETAWRVPEALEYGMVGVNSSLLSTPQAPFGGVKMSGIGREGSKYGLEEYVETKYLSIQF